MFLFISFILIILDTFIFGVLLPLMVSSSSYELPVIALVVLFPLIVFINFIAIKKIIKQIKKNNSKEN